MNEITTSRPPTGGNVTVEYLEKHVQIPCRVVLSTVVADRGNPSSTTTCYADVIDASNRTIQRFSPDLANLIDENAQATVVALASGLAERLNGAFEKAQTAANAAIGDAQGGNQQGAEAQAPVERQQSWTKTLFFMAIGGACYTIVPQPARTPMAIVATLCLLIAVAHALYPRKSDA